MKWKKGILPLLCFLVLGFVQERAKVSLNYYLEQHAGVPGFFDWPPDRRDAWVEEHRPDAPYDYYYNHGSVSFYDHMSLRHLQMLKWAYAGGFILLNYLLAVWLCRRVMGKSKVGTIAPVPIPIYIVYLVAMLVSGFFFGLNAGGWAPEASYAIARKLLGFMHSPLPAFLVLLAAKLPRS